jgi:hypothetical protein
MRQLFDIIHGEGPFEKIGLLFFRPIGAQPEILMYG